MGSRLAQQITHNSVRTYAGPPSSPYLYVHVSELHRAAAMACKTQYDDYMMTVKRDAICIDLQCEVIFQF